MKKPYLHTSVEITATLQVVPAPSAVRIALQSKHKPVVKKKQIVGRGELLAEISSKGAFNQGFIHSSIDGLVEDVLPDAIVIAPIPAPKEGEEAPVPVRPEPCTDLDTLGGEELCRKLLELGVDTSNLHATRTLVINALNPEPGVIVSEFLLKHAQETLKTGLQLLEKALKPGAIKLVAAPGKQISLYGCTTVNTSDRYPATIDPLVVYAATGAERPDNVDVISVADLYQVGCVAETKLPLTDTVISIGGKVLQVPIGTSVERVLEKAEVGSGSEWKISLGGPMRGEAIFDLSTGIPKNCHSITLIPEGAYPSVAPNACINCGECVLACPARIQPGMLSRHAEFKLYDATRAQHIDACLECGMCTFVCPANRPVMQYILLAKRALAAQDEDVATCRLQD